MQKYSRDTVAEVLGRTDIVDTIGAVLELKPSGAGRFKALCPFHNEKTPSFTVSRDRQQYYCFGCEKHGDAISFLCEYEGLTFMEALRKLADKAGVRLPALSERDHKEEYLRAELVKLGQFATRFFRECLDSPLKGSQARQYMKTRDLAAKTVERFALGFAPDGWANLLEAARKAGFKDTVLEASGLVKRGDRGSLYDFFRNRLMIPIRDVSGNVVAFGGRDLGDGVPKYINSPENALYKKSRVLYGLYEAREAMRKQKSAILVEGYFDLMRCFDAGIENVVAPCGTALTHEQARLIRRYAHEVIVVFDADAAGVNAALRGIGILTDAGLTVRAMTVPDGKDPDDFIKAKGREAFEEMASAASDFVTFYVRSNRGRTATIEGRTAVAREIFEILAGVGDELRREEYLKKAAKQLQLNEWTCRKEFSRYLREQSRPRGSGQPQRRGTAEAEEAKRTAFSRDDILFVAVLLNSAPLLDEAAQALNEVEIPAGPLRDVTGALLKKPGKEAIRSLLETEDAQRLYAAASTLDDTEIKKKDELVHKRIIRIQRDCLEAEENRIHEELREAEDAKDQNRVLKLLTLKSDIKRRIDKLDVA